MCRCRLLSGGRSTSTRLASTSTRFLMHAVLSDSGSTVAPSVAAEFIGSEMKSYGLVITAPENERSSGSHSFECIPACRVAAGAVLAVVGIRRAKRFQAFPQPARMPNSLGMNTNRKDFVMRFSHFIISALIGLAATAPVHAQTAERSRDGIGPVIWRGQQARFRSTRRETCASIA